MKDVLRKLKKSGKTHVIQTTNGMSTNGKTIMGTNTNWNTKGHYGFSPESGLIHELTHALQKQEGRANRSVDKNKDGTPDIEEEAMDVANDYRKHVGEDLRDGYDDHNSDPNDKANDKHKDSCSCKK